MSNFTNNYNLSNSLQHSGSFSVTNERSQLVTHTCLLCNISISENVPTSPDNKKLLCKIYKVLPPTLRWESDCFSDELFGTFCRHCSFYVEELCNLERQICNLRTRMDEMQVKISNYVVNSFASTSCHQIGYFVKRQIYERWFERCHEGVNIWESTPMPMSTQNPAVVVNSQQSEKMQETTPSNEVNIRVIPVERLAEDSSNNEIENDCLSMSGFPPSPCQEDTNDSVEVVFAPVEPVLPLPCVIRKVKKPKSKHSKKKRKKTDKKKKKATKLGKKSSVKTKSPKKTADNCINEEQPTSPDPGPPPLSPMDNYDSSNEGIHSEEQVPPTPTLMLVVPNVKSKVQSNNKKKEPPIPKLPKEIKGKPGPPKLHPDRFTCPYCQKKFTQKCNFDAHVNLHTGEKPYKCKICGKAFASRGNRITHEATHDKTRFTGEPQFQCEFCDKKFHIKNTLWLHTHRRHTNNQKPICEFCNVEVIDLQKHVTKLHTVSAKRPSKCATCHFTFPDDLYLQMHQSIHTSTPLKYQCKTCRRGFNKRFKINDHLKKVHKITDFNSNIAVAPAEECLDQMESRKKKEKIKSIKGRRGRLRVPGTTDPSIKKEKTPKMFMCEICGKIFKQSYSHLVHLRTHTGEKPYKCKFCDRTFTDGGNRRKHEATHDKNRLEGEPQLECKDCGKKFHLAGSLYHHTRKRHLGIKYKLKSKAEKECDICGAILRGMTSLFKHKKSLHSEDRKSSRPHQCVLCLKVFANEYSFKVHQFEHNKKIECEQFKCAHCPPLVHKLFSKEDMYEHCKEAHVDIKQEDILLRKTYLCPQCPKTYFLKKSMLDHLGRSHEKVKGYKRIRYGPSQAKRKTESDSESESENEESLTEMAENKQLEISKTCKKELKVEPRRNPPRLKIQQSLGKAKSRNNVANETKATASDRLMTTNVKNLLAQCKELRVILHKIDREVVDRDDDIEIKEEILYF